MPKTSITMHRFRFLGIAFTLLGSLALSSCQDHLLSPPTPTPARFRITSYNYRQSRNFYTATFTYGTSGKITSFQENNYNALTTATLTYNEKGQLIRLDRVPTDGNPATPGTYNTYEYDQAGNLAKRTRYVTKTGYQSPDYYKVEEFTFEYDANAPYPSRLNQFIYDQTGAVITRYRQDLTYKNGNAVRSVYTNLTDSRISPITADFQFDDKPNPFYNFVGAPEGFEGLLPYNRNNVIYSNSDQTYNSGGFITQWITNRTVDPAFQAVYNYGYEQY